MISLFPALLSAESWTIQKCVDEALRNSWSYQESQIALEKSDVALREAVAKRGLNLSGSASHSLSDTPLAQNDPSGVENSSSIGLSASLPLYSGGSISAAIAKSRFQKEAVAANHQLRQEQIALTVVQTVLSYFQWSDEVVWREGTKESCDSSLARTRALFVQGIVLESDTMLAAGECANEEISLITARDGVDRSLREIKKWVGLSAESELTLAPLDSAQLLRQEIQPLSELLQEYRLHSPQLRIDSLQLLLAEEEEQIARASGRMQLNLSASASTGIRWTPADYGDELKDRYQHGVTLALSVPIFNRGATAAAVERALLDKRQQQIDRERNWRQLQEQIEDLWLQRRLLVEQLPAADLAMKASEINYQNDRQKQSVGAISYADLLQSRNSRDAARYRWQQTLWSLVENSWTIDLYLGRILHE